MQTTLHLKTSIYCERGQSSRLAAEFVAWLPAARVILRDLARDVVPHLEAARHALQSLIIPVTRAA
jgi:FMN-dependent NADH-azoreductase